MSLAMAVAATATATAEEVDTATAMVVVVEEGMVTVTVVVVVVGGWQSPPQRHVVVVANTVWVFGCIQSTAIATAPPPAARGLPPATRAKRSTRSPSVT